MKVAEAFDKVPREAFIPDVVWIQQPTGWAYPLRRSEDPEQWLALVHSDESVITQVDDGATERGIWPTSSASAPPIMAAMLETLDVRDGLKVLEIGTGTGYNAALLAELAGPHNVTTVEIDPGIAEQACTSLQRAGYPVEVITADGTSGHPGNAPYDRVIATAAACQLPYEWVRQTRPGGFILAPWGPTFHPDQPLVLLTVADDGTAQGRFSAPAWFMPLRGQRLSQAVRQRTEATWEQAGRPEVTRFGVTITSASQHIWLDDPSHVIEATPAPVTGYKK